MEKLSRNALVILTIESKQRLSVPLLGSRGIPGDVVIVKYFNDLCGNCGSIYESELF